MQLQKWAKKWSLGCKKFLPGLAWLLLSKTGPLFSPSLYMVLLLGNGSTNTIIQNSLGSKSTSLATVGRVLYLNQVWRGTQRNKEQHPIGSRRQRRPNGFHHFHLYSDFTLGRTEREEEAPFFMIFSVPRFLFHYRLREDYIHATSG